MSPLTDWFLTQLQNISRADTAQSCHLLLCALDLGLTSHGLTNALARVAAHPSTPELEKTDIVTAFLRQITLQRYGAAEEERRDFLRRWLLDRGYRDEDLVTQAWVMGLATEQKELLPQSHQQLAHRWFVKRDDVTALRVRAWAPHYLEAWGEHELARARAAQLLSERSKAGSWDQSPDVNASVAYALSQARCVSPEELAPTADSLQRKLARGFAGAGPNYPCNALKFFKAIGQIPDHELAHLRRRAQAERSVFLSYSKKDLPRVRRLAADLKRHGVRVWLSETEIKPGEPITEKLQEAIAEMRYLFLVASQASLSSSWVKRELGMAVHEDIEARKSTVIPIRIDSTPLPGFLRDTKHVDLIKDEDYQDGLQELLRLFD